MRFTLKNNYLESGSRLSGTGIGIEKDKQSIIFKEFTQANANTTRKYGGTGLGLSIAQTLIHQHGGWIDCESWPGQTAFTLYLPLNNSGEEECSK